MKTTLMVRLLAVSMVLVPLQPRPASAAEEKKQDITWSLSGEARFRPEWRDNFDLDESVDDDVRNMFMRIRLGVDVMIRDDYRIFVQAQDSREGGEESPSASAATSTNARNLDIHQGYAEIRKTGVEGLSLDVGRQEWIYGEHRMIGNFGWNNVGRAFDGVRIRYVRDRFFVHGLAARISNTLVAGATHGSDLYGVEYQASARKSGEYGGYWLEFADNLGAPGETGLPGTTRIDALGARMKDRFGPFDLNVEAAAETGEYHGDDLRAHAAAAQGGFNWGEKHRFRAFAGYDYATGDRNASDGKREEFFNFFPTNHLHYGYADFEGWRNLRSPSAGVSWTVGRHFAQAKTHRFALQEAGGPWKDAGGNVLGFDPAGRSGTDVGTETDLTYRFTLKEKASLEGGYSHLTPGGFAKATRGIHGSDWAYVQLTIGF